MSEVEILADSSGIDFLSTLPVGWNVKALGAVCEPDGGVQTGPFGSQLHAADYVPEGVPSIMPVNIGDNRIVEEGIARIKPDDAKRLSKYLVAKGDIVYSRRGDVERRALVTDKENGWLCGTGCLRVRLMKSVNSIYASYYLGHPEVKAWIVRHAQGATMPNLNTSILSQLPFAVPPRNAQDAIAHFLASIDAKVDVLRNQNKTLEAMARAIFKSWFVDFDPVRAKAEGRTPEGMDAATAALFPSTFTDSPLGPIPEGWRYGPLSESIDIISGGTPKTSISDYWGGDIPWFSVVDAPRAEDVFVLDTEKKITSLGLSKCASILLDEGITIITARGTVGKLALVGRPMAMNQSCYGLKGRDRDSSFFVYFNIKKTVAELQSKTHGSVFDTITKATFDGVHAHYATPEVLASFERIVGQLMKRIKLNCEFSGNLSQLRDTLLPRLISGKLRLTDAQALTEDAT